MTEKAVCFDTETTGLGEQDRVIEIAMLDNDYTNEFVQRFNPGMPIPDEATKVHGITDADVWIEPPIRDYIEYIRQRVESAAAVIGQNPWFDQRMLDQECARLGLPRFRWPTLVCTKRTWDIYEPREERHLMNAFKRFVDRRGFDNAHSALADVRATLDVMHAQIKEFGLHEKSWDDLDPERKLWWMDSSHILIVESTLVMNFGKHRGKPVQEVDVGFWNWLITRDFPKHVLMLAMEATRQREANASLDIVGINLLQWAINYRQEHS